MKKYDRVIYKNNPLENVLIQLKFPPILLIDSKEPAEFQEKIRGKFPYYNSFVNKLSNNELQDIKKNYIFRKNQNGNDYIILNRDSISLNTDKYDKWENFKKNFKLALDSFESIYKPNLYTRIGLKYTDIISRKKLNKPKYKWSDLINEKYLGFISEEFEIIYNKNQYIIRLDKKNNIANISTSIEKRDYDNNCFCIDTDLSFIGEVKNNEIENRINCLHSYSRPIFRDIITEKLHKILEANAL